MRDLDGLIEKIEGLEGPDRQADLDIAVAVGVLPDEVGSNSVG